MTSEPAPTTAAADGRAHLHEPLPADRAARWRQFGRWEQTYFPAFVGLEVEEIRVDYARMRLPYRPELRQPAGMVHGGAIATLVDTVVVPAIGAAFDTMPVMMTIDMQIRYLGATRETDLVAEGWVVKRGRSIVFCQAEIRGVDQGLLAEGWLTYRVIVPDAAGPA